MRTTRFAYAALAAATLALPAFATVNVNNAQQSELQRTRGLDKYKAKAIIDYRNQHGPIDNFDELQTILGADTTEKVKPQIAFSGPPYTPPPKPEPKAKSRAAKK